MTILFGFPGAGAGVHVFRIWKEKLGNAIDFQEIAYNKTYGSSYLENIKDAAERSATQVLSYNANEDEIYFFGHCMGAIVAYETAKLLATRNGIFIRGLFISAFTSPDCPIEDGISHLDDLSFAKEIQSHGTFPEEFFINPSILKLFLPRIKADYKMIESYCDKDHYALNCPIAGFFGQDDGSVPPESIRGWAGYTTREFLKFYFPGDHYFYYDHQEEIIERILALIDDFHREETGQAERSTAMEDLIIKLLAETIEKEDAAASWNSETDIINEIGVDSLQLVRFLLKLEEQLDITFDYDQLTFDDLATIGTLAKFLSKMTQKQNEMK